jgi:outer membrane protein insertion porin family
LLGSVITGYGGKVAPPFARSFIGGENDVRGFDFYSITPIAFIPSSASVPQLNPDGSQRVQTQLVGGVKTPVSVQLPIPTYQVITPGGDTHGVFNFEYRIPVIGPVTVVPFFDAGINRILFTNQLTVNPGQITNLNSQFPQAAFSNRVKIAPGTQNIRMSTGIEIDVVLPIVQAPFRVYYAYNPSIVREYLQPPIVVDRSMFPNNATFTGAIVGSATAPGYGVPFPFFEKRGTFRFTIGRTF